ncbi:unnamed protein product [Pieris macdunnoughi]|uniref:Reverse transcriptase domain-containing protein n=1 Tax=Pieris macdunnoughi TaxID=345717 RepID=A0A821XI52_9NEOP|nr:unnamed protein product [Pieris macdunnoughi]
MNEPEDPAEQNVDICLLNETWLKDTQQFKISGYNFHYHNAQNEHGGVAILIKPYFKYNIIQTRFYQDIQTVALSLYVRGNNLTILCVYCPPSNSNFRISKLRDIIRDLPKPIYVAGDFNAHHVAFGCMTTKSRGHQLYDLIDEFDLCVLNNGNFTTINYPNRNPSAIDVSFCSAPITPLCEWWVHDDCMGSYHFPTLTRVLLSVDRYQINPPIEKFLYNKTDWTKYNELSISAFSNFEVNNENPLQSYDEFIERLVTLKRDTVPKFVKSNNYRCKPPAPWWNDTCEQSVIKTYKALKLYRRDPTIDNYINYKRLDAVKKKTISEHKRNGWANICNTFSRTTPVSIIWKYIKLFKRIKCNNRTYKDEFVVPLLEKLSQNECRVIDNLESYFQINNSIQKSSFLIEPFTWSEFCTSLQSRRNTTPGLDDCPYILIKNLNQSVQKKLLANLNALWHLKKIPESWKTQCVIPILKLDKPPEDPNSYRPISLSSCVGKLNENMIKMRLECYVEANNIIPHVQYGFRRGRSCADSFISLLSDLKYANNNNKSSVCVFLDVQGAFDNVDPGILVQVLSDTGIPDHNVDRAVNSINKALDQLYIYYNDRLALQINPNKSKAMIFSKDFPSNGILYNNHSISVVPNHKFLGVVIDNKLCFDLHINHIITNSLKGLNIIRCLAGVTWGADPKVLSMLYRSIVRSHFDYSCLAYSNSRCVKKLDIIQNKALRIISGAMCSTPIRAMEVETKIMPLCIRRLLLIERYLLKLLSGNDNVLKKIVHFPIQCSAQQTLRDGSKSELFVRSAVYDPQSKFGQSFLLDPKCSIFTAEVSFMWIPSHRGITGNEIVDKIARDGINMLDVSSIVKVPLTDCYQSIDNQVNSLWGVEFWKQDQEQKGYKHLLVDYEH